MFERHFKYERMPLFIFKYLILEIVTFFYHANKEIKTLNREYLQNITAVFFSNKENGLTAYVLLPCLHSRLQYLSAKKNKNKNKTKNKTKHKTKQIFEFVALKVRHKSLLGTQWYPYCH